MKPKSEELHPMIAPGIYDAKWSAYNLKIQFKNGKESDTIKVDEGVRGIDCPCKVEVDGVGLVTIID